MRSFWKRRLVWILFAIAAASASAACLVTWWPPTRIVADRAYEKTAGRVLMGPDEKIETTRARLAALTNGAALPLANARVHIDKRNRRATLYSGDRAIKNYKIALGQRPEGHKQKEGDSRTPQGTYYICTRLNKSKFYYFLGLNYPNGEDARRGIAEKLITPAQQEIIADAEKQRNAPSWTTPLGGAIGLHGGGTAHDWTAGCIAFDDDAIEEIWLSTDYWTPVKIE